MDEIKNALDMLGLTATDRVTAFAGTIVSISFDVSGCIQGGLVSEDRGEKAGEFRWFDMKRLNIHVNGVRILPAPEFERIPGGQNLPDFPQKPSR